MIEGLREPLATEPDAELGHPVYEAPPTRGEPIAKSAEVPRADRFWRDVRLRRMLALADLCAGAAASAVLLSSPELGTWAFLFLPVWILIAKLLGLYERDHRAVRHLTVDEFPSLAAWAGSGVLLLGLFLEAVPDESVSIGRATVAAAAGAVAAGALRALARSLHRVITPPEKTAVIGDGELARAARRKIELFRDMHLELVEAGDPSIRVGNGAGDAALQALARRVDRILIASERLDPDWIGRLVEICRQSHVKLNVVSPLRGKASAAPRLSEVADLPVLEYDTWDVSRSTILIKRAFDIATSTAALAVLLPLFPFVALAIVIDSPGPVFFRQRRAGLGGREFMIWKLRTMEPDAEERLREVVRIEDLAEPSFKLRRDPRMTRVGRLLRRFSIDELPQLVNVLKGEMSIVGPRPEQMILVNRYQPEHRVRLAVRPGMTGPMQVFGRGALTFSERMAVELDYIDNISLSRDLRIIGQTIPALIRGTGAY
jgi:exopolysaccharide biosynthesis polyprenyl glycosylphosphotransferase